MTIRPVFEVVSVSQWEPGTNKINVYLETGNWTVLNVRHQFFGPVVYTLGRIHRPNSLGESVTVVDARGGDA